MQEYKEKAMEKKQGFLMKVLPLLLIVFGFLTLNMFQGFVAITCLVIGIVILIERKWPETWNHDNENGNTAVKQS